MRKAPKGMKYVGPNHPDWDEKYCGWRLPGGTFCVKLRSRRADRSTRKYCHWHTEEQLDMASVRVAHGKNSYVLRDEVAAKFNAFRQNTQLLDLTEEVSLFRAYLVQGIEHWQREGELSLDEINWALTGIERFSKLVETVVRIRTTTALTVAEINYLQAGVAAIFKEFVPPENLRPAIEAVFKLTANTEQTKMNYDDYIIDGVVVKGEDPLPEQWRYIRNKHGVLGK